MPPLDIKSPLLTHLQSQLKILGSLAFESFWQSYTSPLIESLEDDSQLLVTFLYRNSHPGNHLLLLGTPANFDAISKHLQRLEDTDLWYLSKIFPKDLRTVYAFFPNAPELPTDFIQRPQYDLLANYFKSLLKHLMPDVLNPHSYTIPAGIWLNPQPLTVSLLELPKASFLPLAQACLPQESLHVHDIQSKILGNTRKVWVYAPFSNLDMQHEPHNLIIMFDGDAYTRLVPTAALLENLVQAKKILPTVAIFIDNPDDETRDRELGCNPLILDFLEHELLPTLVPIYGLKPTPSHTVIAGSSYGGLAAFYAGLSKPGLFGNILSLSAHLGWGAENNREDMWLIQQYGNSPKQPIQIYFSVGTLETGPPTFDLKPSFLQANRTMCHALQTKDYMFKYVEYSGGHDYICWQQQLAEGLVYLLNPTIR